MTPTIQAVRRGALGVFVASLAAVLLATGTPQTAAHTDRTPEAPLNLRVEGVPDHTHNTIRVSWNPGHSHEIFHNFRLVLYTSPLPAHPFEADEHPCIRPRRGIVPPGCIRPSVSSARLNYSERVSGLTPETTYYVYVAQIYSSALSPILPGYGATATFTTTAAPGTPDPETPTTPDPETPDPETPTTPDPVTPDPETPTTPEPEAPDCTYEHRLIGVPGTTGGGFTSQILISSKDSKATAKLRAYQAFNGAPIDVLDSEGSAVGYTTSLSPANSVKQFRLEGARGWHTVIVEHPTARAMRRATVAMRLREPDTGVSIILAERIEDCEPVATTTE